VLERLAVEWTMEWTMGCTSASLVLSDYCQLMHSNYSACKRPSPPPLPQRFYYTGAHATVGKYNRNLLTWTFCMSLWHQTPCHQTSREGGIVHITFTRFMCIHVCAGYAVYNYKL